MSQITLTGFGDEKANGLYDELGTHDGFPFYKKTTGDYIIIYKLENGPYSFSPAYWVEELTDNFSVRGGPIDIWKPKYVNHSSDIFSEGWIPILDSTSGESDIGLIEPNSSSSSSGGYSESSHSSSSSSSENYSESSSSENYSSSSSENYSESSSSENYSESSSSSSEDYSESSSTSIVLDCLESKMVAPDGGFNDQFGTSVTIGGDYAVIGAPNDVSVGGSAYIYNRTGLNTWDAGVKVIADHFPQTGDKFGSSVSIDGDYVIVGAKHTSAEASRAGDAHIFHRTGTNTWDTGFKIRAINIGGFDYYGTSVGISGDYVVVGAPGEDTGASANGAAYVHMRTGTNTWDTGVKILASDHQADDAYGTSAGISGDYIVVGAPREDAGGSNAGAVYIHMRTGANIWDTGVKIVASDAQAGDSFGYSVSIDGDYAVVGAYSEDSGAGAVYVFNRTGTNTWDAGVKILATSPSEIAFGWSVSISGDTIAVGGFDGRVHVYERTGLNTWSYGHSIISLDAGAADYFGRAVAVDGQYVISGAYVEDSVSDNAGAAYSFYCDEI